MLLVTSFATELAALLVVQDAGGVLAVLLYGCESWCLTAESVRRLANWHNKRIREMCRVTVLQTHVYRITSESPQKRTGVFSLEHYLASRTLLWAGFTTHAYSFKRFALSRLPHTPPFSPDLMRFCAFLIFLLPVAREPF